MSGKIVVTNASALRAKYQSAGLTKIKSALRTLIAADKKRGLTTKVVFLDSATAMAAVGGAAVADPTDEQANKAAVDRVFDRLDPDYLVLLGAPDVVPHLSLRNPMYGPDDEDRVVPSDLPYACSAPYGTRIASFLGPTRVVGRLPDVTGSSDVRYLVGLIQHAAKAKPAPYSDYAKYLGVTAKVWTGSTSLSLENIFGSSNALKVSPPSGPKWSASDLSARSHFINCHGSPSDPHYYGQQGNQFPIAHDAAYLAGKVAPGTVLSAECCYGAELYDAAALGLPLPIANTYLGDDAHGVFGSTTIAYGPPTGNDQADILCQEFLLSVLSGASLGRATLQARQAFVGGAAQLDPVNLKTLAQFILLGDPSIHPVESTAPDGLKTLAAFDLARAERRVQLKAVGGFLATSKAAVTTGTTKGVKKGLRASLASIAKKERLQVSLVRSFALSGGPRLGRGKAVAAPSSYLLLQGAIGTGDDPRLRGCIVAKVSGGRIVGYRIYHRR